MLIDPPVRWHCRVLHIGTIEQFREVEAGLLPESRLILENAVSGQTALVELGTRTAEDLPNLVLGRVQSLGNAAAFVREAKASEHLGSIPIVLITSNLTAAHVDELYLAGASCVLTEPISTMLPDLQTLKNFWMTVATLPYCSDPTTVATRKL